MRGSGSHRGNLSDEPLIAVRLLNGWIVGIGLILFLTTSGLWLGAAGLPTIPISSHLLNVSFVIDAVAYGFILSGLAVFGASLHHLTRRRISAGLFVTGLVVATALDQNRLQVWAWHWAWMIVLLAIDPGLGGRTALRRLTIAIYFWSALAKCDVVFADTLGPYFLQGLFSTLHVPVVLSNWSPLAQQLAALTLPVAELITAACLLEPRLRMLGLALSLSLHSLLLITLGPWGLGHSRTVLIWNVFFLGQNVLLFSSWFDRNDQTPIGEVSPETSRCWALRGAWVPILLPLLHTGGWLDHWPAWAVYAPRMERVRVYVRPTDNEETRWLIPADEEGTLFQFRAELACLETFGVPLSPQGRIQLGWALWRLSQSPNGGFVEWQSAADLWTGERTSRTLITPDEIREFASETFWLNAEARIRR